MRYLRQNTAVRVTIGPFLDKTDGVTPEIALTVTNCHLTLTKDDDDGTAVNLVLDAAATASAGNNDMVHIANDNAGFYDLELTQANTNYNGRAMLAITDAANHCPVFHEFMIVNANVYDSLYKAAATDYLQTDVVQWLGQACAVVTVNGVPEVDVTHLGGVAQSATDLKDFADAGYDPATNKVQGVVLTDTCTTNSDMVGTNAAALAATALTSATWTDAKAVFLDHAVSTVDTVVDGIQTDLSNVTDGLGALKALIDTVDGVVDAIEVDTKRLYDTSGVADADSPVAGSIAESIRWIRWFIKNEWRLDEVASPDTLKIYKDNNTTEGFGFTVYASASVNYRDPV